MLKSVKNTSVQQNPARAQVSPTLGEKLNAFVDKFEKRQEYPPAIVNISAQHLRKRKCTILPTMPIETMPPNPKGQTRFHTAALLHDRKWMRFICHGAEDEHLLKADIYGKMPLHYAAQRGLLGEMVSNRNSREALLQAPDDEANTPLHIMAKAQKFDRSVLKHIKPATRKKLLEVQNQEGQTVLQIIKNNGDQRLLNALSLLCIEKQDEAKK